MCDCQDEPELCLAHGFQGVIDNLYPGPIPLGVLTGGTATFLVAYLVQLAPKERMLLLSDMLDAVISGFNDNPITDLLN